MAVRAPRPVPWTRLPPGRARCPRGGRRPQRGESRLVFVVPVVIASGPLAVLGILLIFVGFFLTFLSWSAGPMPPPPAGPAEVPSGASPEPARLRRWGGVLFLGPIPLVFGSDPEMTRMMLILGVILFLALL